MVAVGTFESVNMSDAAEKPSAFVVSGSLKVTHPGAKVSLIGKTTISPDGSKIRVIDRGTLHRAIEAAMADLKKA